jgi:hypothetical protein
MYISIIIKSILVVLYFKLLGIATFIIIDTGLHSISLTLLTYLPVKCL